MHPEFRHTTIRQRERELNAALRNARAHERTVKEIKEPFALRLIWSSSDGTQMAPALAAFRLAGGS
jgi:hypothetical protein